MDAINCEDFRMFGLFAITTHESVANFLNDLFHTDCDGRHHLKKLVHGQYVV